MPKIVDLTNQRFTRLTVIKRSDKKWVCVCDCGNRHSATTSNLLRGNVRSCGCLQKERAAEIGAASGIDRKGERFGRLVALKLDVSATKRKWICLCDCGNKVSVLASSLGVGQTQSCGCLQKERAAQSNEERARHGATRNHVTTPTWRSWKSMHDRCKYKSMPSYALYGGRGIKVCKRWTGPSGFQNFLSDMGERPEGTTLDRKNNDRDYKPSNCRWSTSSEQSLNRRNTPEYAASRKKNLDAGRRRMWDDPELRAKLLASRAAAAKKKRDG